MSTSMESSIRTIMPEVGKATAKRELQSLLDRFLEGRSHLNVLDAGCGGATRLQFPRDTVLTGLDISPDNARRNGTIENIIIGDVQTYVFRKNSFDVIVCWEVLEHVEDPLCALSLFFEAVKKDGIIILALPNVLSLKGLVTKFTPHWFHVWFLRRCLKKANAGKPGFAPFPTYLPWSLAPKSLVEYGEKHGAVVYFRAYVGSQIGDLRRKSWIGYYAYATLVRLLNLMSFGGRNFALSDMYLVLRRRPERRRLVPATPVSRRAAGRH